VDVGVGLPTTTPGASGPDVIRWARRAEEASFAGLGVLDRPAYDSLDPLAALAAAAAVTSTIELITMVVIGPIRATALLAKQSASIDAMSRGRLTLGLSLGARTEDYDAVGVDHGDRGVRLTEQLIDLRSTWVAGDVSPTSGRAGGPRILVGGASGRSFSRAARFGQGYVHGGGPPRAFARAAEMAHAAWADLGRPGRPLLYGQGYFALGSGEAGAAYLRDYYAFTGPFAERIAAANLTTPHAIRDFVRGYEDAGCDHLVLFPTVADLTQLDRLADVLA